ncbi:MAG TPA: DJ-1/PfpI family protein [Sedimentisphaerales bacterium]|nr:DJ-1/PfpI family protein [Sedimentisphaerales bacterium]
MKRLTILAIVLACFATLCLGRSRTRSAPQMIIQLTDPNLKGTVSLEEALARRRSIRQFSSEPVKRSQISQLAWAGQGITEPQRGLRTAPSAGAIYPIELLFATQEGLFVYRPADHSLLQTGNQDIRNMLAAAASMAESVAGAGCDIIVAGAVRKLTSQYKDKARTYMHMEAGHIAQNIQLQAVCLDLGSVTVGGFDSKEVRKVCKLSRDLEPLYIICVGYPAGQGTTETTDGQAGAAGKRAVLIIGSQNFRDEELFDTKRVLDAAQVQTVIASTRTGVIQGVLGNVAEASIPVNRLKVDDYDAIIFIGGPGAAEYVSNPTIMNMVRETVRKGKVLGAIGVAPTILANANVLAGIRATSFLSERDRLVQAGAIYTVFAVERERSIITATGPDAAVQFGRAITNALAGR